MHAQKSHTLRANSLPKTEDPVERIKPEAGGEGQVSSDIATALGRLPGSGKVSKQLLAAWRSETPIADDVRRQVAAELDEVGLAASSTPRSRQAATRNLREARFGDVSGSAPEWAREFDLWAKETVEGGDIDAILDFEHTAPAALIAHPRTEHFGPLVVSLGAVADAKVDAVSAVDGFGYGLAKRSFQFN